MRSQRISCAVVVILGFLVVAGGILYALLASGLPGLLASDPSYLVVSSPLDHATVLVGEPVYVRVTAELSHRNFGGVALYVDGERYALDQKLQAYAPKNSVKCASQDGRYCGSAELALLWMPAQASVHTLVACVFGDEQPAPAWNICSEGIGVAVVDPAGVLPSAGNYIPQPGDTLPAVAAKFGLRPELVAAANPQVDPAGSLESDTPIHIPADPGLAPPAAAPSPNDALWSVDQAKVTPARPIDKGYCYYSFGGDLWSRAPAAPQTFAYPLDGQLDLSAEFRSVPVPPAGGTLSMECWGWSGASLLPLGAGKTTLVPSTLTFELQADQFTLAGRFVANPGAIATPVPPGGIFGPLPSISPPKNLDSTSTLSVCVNHFPADFWFTPGACADAITKGMVVLVWDWPSVVYPAGDPAYITNIDGYHVYQVTAPGKYALVGKIVFADKHYEILPASWAASKTPPTFVVRAYKGKVESPNSNLYTLTSNPPGLETVRITADPVLYGGATKKKQDVGCGTGLPVIVGSAPLAGGGDVAVGYEHAEPEGSCLKYYWEYSRAQVVFGLGPVKGPVSSAQLWYREDFTAYAGLSCARKLGIVTTTTSGSAMKDLAYDPYMFLGPAGFPGDTFIVDVTSAVRDWTLGTPNAGFLMLGDDESLPPDDYEGFTSQRCWSAYNNLILVVTYFKK